MDEKFELTGMYSQRFYGKMTRFLYPEYRLNKLETKVIKNNRKEAIAQAFGKAASKYDSHAEFQRQVGHALINKMPQDLQGKKVLDIGCGTGYFSQLLAEKGAIVTAADLSLEMLDQAELRCGSSVIHYQQADAESLPFKDSCFDFVFSSLALQWCEDLSVPLKELRRVTKPGGSLYFSTLLDGSLQELKISWSNIDTHQHVNEFISEKHIKIALAQSESEAHHLDLRAFRMWYSSAFQLMRDLKGIGATHVCGRSQGLMKKQTLLNVENEYQKFKSKDGRLPATYKVCLGAVNL